jgi:hypothetical protein
MSSIERGAAARFQGHAARIMCPGVDFGWLTSPDGTDVRSLFRSAPSPVKIYHPRLLYDWGLALMDEALSLPNPLRRAVRYRNGLAIADPRRPGAAPALFGGDPAGRPDRAPG